jgi:hypothetical protein
MPLNPLRPPGKLRPLPAYRRKYRGQREKKSGWDKASVIIQAIGGLAILVSLAGLFIGVRQFNVQQKTNATNLVNQQHQATLDKYLDSVPKFSRLTRGLRWVILAIIVAVTLAGCPSTGTTPAGPSDQPAQTSAPPSSGAVPNEGDLTSKSGCGPGCTPPASPSGG